MEKYIQPLYPTTQWRQQHCNNADLFSTLYNTIKSRKEQQFFAYIVTQIESLLEKYPKLVILRDVDETMCHRIKPEEDWHYDVIRAGLLPTLHHLHTKYPTQLSFGILSSRAQRYIDQIFKQKAVSDRPDAITDYFSIEYIFSSMEYRHDRCPDTYTCKNNSSELWFGPAEKASAHHDISSRNPDKKYILIDDCIGFWQKYVAQFDRHIPFPIALVMGEEDAILQR